MSERRYKTDFIVFISMARSSHHRQHRGLALDPHHQPHNCTQPQTKRTLQSNSRNICCTRPRHRYTSHKIGHRRHREWAICLCWYHVGQLGSPFLNHRSIITTEGKRDGRRIGRTRWRTDEDKLWHCSADTTVGFRNRCDVIVNM